MHKTKSPNWQAIEKAWCEGVKVIEIENTYNISRYRITQRADKFGWPLRGRTYSVVRLRKRRLYMVQRTWNVITEKIRIFEQRIADGEMETRDVNALRTIVSLIEKLGILEKQIREEETQHTGAKNDQAEHLRTGLAKRLAQLETEAD